MSAESLGGPPIAGSIISAPTETPDPATRGLSPTEAHTSAIGADILPTTPLSETPHTPVSEHKVEPHSIAEDVGKMMSDQKKPVIKDQKIQKYAAYLTERKEILPGKIAEMEKQRETRVKTQLIYGGIIALAATALTASMIASAVMLPGVGVGVALLILGVGLIGAAAISHWGGPKILNAFNPPSEKEINKSKETLEMATKGIDLLESTQESDYSFESFLRENIHSDYMFCDIGDYMTLYEQKCKVNTASQTLENLENELQKLKSIESTDSSPTEELKQQISEKEKEVEVAKKEKRIEEKCFESSLSAYEGEVNRRKNISAPPHTPQIAGKTQGTVPADIQGWVDKKEFHLPKKTWNLDFSSAASGKTPLYMPGNNSESLQGIAEDEKERMASHGLGEQYCYLSASHTPPKPLLIDGSPYHTPFHYVLQEMLKEGAPEVATEISKQPDPKEVLKLIEKLEDIDERLFNYVTTNHIAASSLLKRALFATFVEDGNKPTKLGEELLKTKGRPLVATNELGYEGWGWGATMNADQTEAKGSNLLGHHLGELRDWLEDQNRGIGVKPAAAPTATPASPSAPSTPTAATARSTKRKKPLPAIPPADLEFPAPPTIPGMPQGVHVSAPPTDLPPAFPGDEQG